MTKEAAGCSCGKDEIVVVPYRRKDDGEVLNFTACTHCDSTAWWPRFKGKKAA